MEHLRTSSPSISRLDQTVTRLRALVREEQLGEGKLPPETTLSRQLGVGRSTLREALAMIEAEGLIVRRRRVGTTVNWEPAALKYPAAGVILALSDFLRESGIDYQVRELSVLREPADEIVARKLGCQAGTEIYNVTRVYDISEAPAAYVQHYLPVVINGRAIRIESFQDAVVTFLEQVEQITLQDVSSTITAEAASAELAKKLAVEVGTPLLTMYTTLHGQGSQTVALGRFAFRPDVVSLSATAQGRLQLTQERSVKERR